MPIIWVTGFNILVMLIFFAASFLSESLLSVLLIVFLGASFLINALLYGYAGYRGAKEYSLDILESGAAGAIVFAITFTIMTIISSFSSALIQSATFSSLSQLDEGGSFALAYGGLSFIIMVITYFFSLAAGLVMNFVLGSIGGLIGRER